MSDGLIPNSFTLHSGTSHTSAQRAGEKRETKQEKGRREGIQESQTELLRVGRDINNNIGTANFNLNKSYWGQ